MNIDHASSQSFVRPVAGSSRLRSFLFALGLSLFALVALLVTVILLYLSARSQMHFQTAPTDIKYAPAQRIPAATDRKGAADERESNDADEDGDDGARSGGYGTGIIPGIPGISGGPLFPSAPQAPAYTPAPTAPARSDKAPTVTPKAAKDEPESTNPYAPQAGPTAPPKATGRRESTASDVGRMRRVGTKSFKRDANGFLVDTTYTSESGLETIELVAGTDSYVRLLEARPDLQQYFRLDDRLIVVVDNVVYRVVPKD